MKFFAVAIFIACFVSVFSEKARYDNYRVYSVNVENDEQSKVLRELEAYPDGVLFLESPSTVGQTADLVVPPHKFAEIAELFETFEIKNRIKTSNLQKLIDDEQPKIRSFDGGFGWKEYYDLDAIYGFLDTLLKKYPNVLTGYEYGKSYEGRPLRAVKVSHKKGNPTVFIESNIHAREWVTSATATYFLSELLTSNETEIRYLADNFDWVIVPVTNVDGFVYTHTKDRMWRKTRQPTKNKHCVGVDPNRNWDWSFGGSGTSPFECSQTYPGTKPFSEPETLALSEFIKKFDTKLYLSFHSFSQLVLFPFGHAYEHARNHNDLNRIGMKAKEAISKRYGTDYTVGATAETIYLAAGITIDWVYGVLNVPLSYCFEFRDKGDHGMLLPADQIIPNSLEIIDGIVAMVKEAKTLNYL